jgi:hypothetical protein
MNQLTLTVKAQQDAQLEREQRQQEAARLTALQTSFALALTAAVRDAPIAVSLQWSRHISEAEFYNSLRHIIPCDKQFLQLVNVRADLLEDRPKADAKEVKVVRPWFLNVISCILEEQAPAFCAIATGSTTMPLGDGVGDIRPDEVVVRATDAGRNLADPAVAVVAIVELKSGNNAGFAAAEMGQALGYGHRIVQVRKLPRLLVVLANTTHMQLWELATTPSLPAKILVFDFGMMSLEAGLGRFAASLPLPSVFSLREGAADTLLGLGATSVVFGFADRPDCVAKVVYSDHPVDPGLDFADREREVLTALKSKNIKHVIRLEEPTLPTRPVPKLAARTLVLSPRGTQLKPEDLLEWPALMSDLIEVVRCAHELGYVHCDLRFSNLYLDNQRALVIADWGFAFKKGDAQRPWIGTVITAPTRALLALRDKTLLVPYGADDLEGCVKLARLAALSFADPDTFGDVAQATATRSYRALAAFWAWQLAEPAWAKALTLARNTQYGPLSEALLDLLRTKA